MSYYLSHTLVVGHTIQQPCIARQRRVRVSIPSILPLPCLLTLSTLIISYLWYPGDGVGGSAGTPIITDPRHPAPTAPITYSLPPRVGRPLPDVRLGFSARMPAVAWLRLTDNMALGLLTKRSPGMKITSRSSSEVCSGVLFLRVGAGWGGSNGGSFIFRI